MNLHPSSGPEAAATADRPTTAVVAELVPVEEVVQAELIDERVERRSWWEEIRFLRYPVKIAQTLSSAVEWLFGVATLIVGLAVLASLPVIQFLSLGYLLEVSGRIARTGRARDGFIGIRRAARIGSIALGSWLLLLPSLLLARLSYVSSLVDPSGPATRRLNGFFLVVTTLLVGQIIWAWYRGGRFRDFVWPAPLRMLREFRRPGKYVRARDAVWQFVTGLRLPYYFWLGFRGFVGTLVILALPVGLFVATVAFTTGGGILLVLLGGLLLSVVLMYLPFLQVQFAVAGRLRALFDVNAVRREFAKVPLVYSISLLFTLAAALPLYLLKIEWMPREIAALVGIVFVAFMFPARLLGGYVFGMARVRDTKAHWTWRWFGRLLCLSTAVAYVFVLFFSRFFLWNGHWGLFEQHAFLLPIPFLGY